MSRSSSGSGSRKPGRAHPLCDRNRVSEHFAAAVKESLGSPTFGLWCSMFPSKGALINAMAASISSRIGSISVVRSRIEALSIPFTISLAPPLVHPAEDQIQEGLEVKEYLFDGIEPPAKLVLTESILSSDVMG